MALFFTFPAKISAAPTALAACSRMPSGKIFSTFFRFLSLASCVNGMNRVAINAAIKPSP